MEPTQTILFVLVAVVMGWFAFGVVWNIRRGNAVLKWLQGGLPHLGEKTTLRWLGSSVVELGLAKAKPPFRRAELLLVMEPRDVPWFWVFARLRGRRDTLIFRGQLASAPQFEFDVLAPGSWSEQIALQRGETRRWEAETLAADATFRAPSATRPLSRQVAPGALECARRVGATVWRLSSRREFPHLELHIPLPDPNQQDATEFVSALRALAGQMVQH
jgi:hypothetical protein